jgi:hypothetical protein
VKACRLCNSSFDPTLPVTDPAVEAGLFLAREFYGDGTELCQECLASRGRLGMMYCREFD